MVKRLKQWKWLWKLAFTVAEQGTCDRLRAGCVVAKDGIVVSTGYNGSPPDKPHCDDVGHELVYSYTTDTTRAVVDGGVVKVRTPVYEEHCVRTIHSEMNAIINAVIIGQSLVGCDWFITGVPCRRCSDTILRLSPKRLYFCSDWGGVTDDKRKLTSMWVDETGKGRSCILEGVTAYSYKTLSEMGIIS